MSYNGWPNRETWNVMLWMNNEEPAYRLYRSEVRNVRQILKRRFVGSDARACCEQAFGDKTPDGVRFDSSKIRWGAIARAMREE